MNQDVQVRHFQGSQEEQTCLHELCTRDTNFQFWSYDDIVVSLKIPGTFILYTADRDIWLSLAFGRVVGDDAELFYIYVAPQGRGRGWGEKLLRAFLKEVAEHHKALSLQLEVRTSNLGARRLYEKCGLQLLTVRKRYYADGEDALIYRITFTP